MRVALDEDEISQNDASFWLEFSTSTDLSEEPTQRSHWSVNHAAKQPFDNARPYYAVHEIVMASKRTSECRSACDCQRAPLAAGQCIRTGHIQNYGSWHTRRQ